MRHTREEIIERTVREFEQLNELVSNLTGEEWQRRVPRSESKAPWTVKDVLAHITHWKADVARQARKQPRQREERGLTETAENDQIYQRWRDKSPREVLEWHRQVHEDVLAALREAPEEWFSGRDRRPEWHYDLDGHLRDHRVKDIERALGKA